MRLASGLLIAVLSCLVAETGRADELLLYDGIMTSDDAENGFYWFGVPAANPADWTAPVDYLGGEWHARYEIIEQAPYAAHQEATGLQSCVWQGGKGGDHPETCGAVHFLDGPGSVAYTVESPAAWWEKADSQASAAAFDWTRGGDFVDMGSPTWHRKEDGGRCLATLASWGGCEENMAVHLPMTIRISVVLVSAGATFSGWETYGLGPGDPDGDGGTTADGDGETIDDADGGLAEDGDALTDPDGDAGPDADTEDAGLQDASIDVDADAGADEGEPGAQDGVDGDAPDGGDDAMPGPTGGCACGQTSGGPGWLGFPIALALWSRRRRRTAHRPDEKN